MNCEGREYEQVKTTYVQFEDYESGNTPLPTREEALAGVKSCESVPKLFSQVKACLMQSDNSGGTPPAVNPAENNIYSMEETVCGTWVDGKPLYRKVLFGITEINTGSNYIFANLSDLNIENISHMYGSFLNNPKTAITPAPINFNTAALLNFWYEITTNNIKYNLSNHSGSFSGCEVYLVIEYTKA